MNEEKYVNEIAQVFAITGHGTASILAALSLMADPAKGLVDHLKKGGEIGSDVVIPRKMIPDLVEACKERGIKDYTILDRDSEGEFVTVAYKDALDHKVNDLGDYTKKDGTRVALKSDFKVMHEIMDDINIEYKNRNSKNYFNSKGFEVGTNLRTIDNLDLTEATLLREQLAEYWCESTLKEGTNPGTYMVETPESSFERTIKNQLSGGELAVRDMTLLAADPRVLNYIDEQREINDAVKKVVEGGEMEPSFICQPVDINDYDHMGKKDASVGHIILEGHEAIVHIENPLKGFLIDETLDLRKENDRARFFDDLAKMDGKVYYTMDEFSKMVDITKEREKAMADKSWKDIKEYVHDPYALAQAKADLKEFEDVINKEYGGIDKLREISPDHKGLENYDIKAKNVKDAIKFKETMYTKEDLAFSSYEKARKIDPRIAKSAEAKLFNKKNDKENVLKTSRLDNTTNILVTHVASVTKNEFSNVASEDREIYQQMAENLAKKESDTKMVYGHRVITAEPIAEGKPLTVRSVTSQELKDYCQTYEDNNLEENYNTIKVEYDDEFSKPVERNDNAEDRDMDGIIEESEYDPFGDEDFGENYDSINNDNDVFDDGFSQGY